MAEAQYYIGCCYLDGFGVTANELEALMWLQKSAQQGYVPAVEALKELKKQQ